MPVLAFASASSPNSFIYILKSTGDEGPPCGTPVVNYTSKLVGSSFDCMQSGPNRHPTMLRVRVVDTSQRHVNFFVYRRDHTLSADETPLADSSPFGASCDLPVLSLAAPNVQVGIQIGIVWG